jgi:diadenosine tetraphosphate (Ap4A) HIT family hydrolase
LASPQFESHLVVSVGEEVYACLAKGPLLPMHVLLLPIAHTPCSLMLGEAEAAELARYIGALRKCFEARGATLLLFERYMGSGTFEHMHLQALPLPAQLAGGARDAFQRHGKKFGVDFEVLPFGHTVASRMPDGPEPFFAATLPSGEILLHRMRRNPRRHPLQFGREVVAAMLGNPRRADWKNCLPQPAPGERASTQELEARGAEEFKHAFAAHEPS